MQLSERERAAFSLTSAIGQALDSGLRNSLEAEILSEATRESDGTFTPHRFVIPWQLLGRRDMSAAGASGSNYLVGATNTDVVDALRPVSLAVQAGVSVLPGQVGNLSIPRVTAANTAYWLPDELSPITASQPTVGAIASTPHTVGAVLTYSMLLRRQATPEGFLQRHLLGTIGAALDAAILAGGGINGEPQGLANVSATESVTGANIAWAGICEMAQKSAEANGLPTAYLSTPAVRKLLQGRERAATGNGWIWQGGIVNGLPGLATTSCPTATLFCGPWAEIIVPIWGAGPEVTIDPTTYFSTGKYQMRVLLQADVVVRHPEAFAIAEGVS